MSAHSCGCNSLHPGNHTDSDTRIICISTTRRNQTDVFEELGSKKVTTRRLRSLTVCMPQKSMNIMPRNLSSSDLLNQQRPVTVDATCLHARQCFANRTLH
eukprot:gene8270-10168_t